MDLDLRDLVRAIEEQWAMLEKTEEVKSQMIQVENSGRGSDASRRCAG